MKGKKILTQIRLNAAFTPSRSMCSGIDLFEKLLMSVITSLSLLSLRMEYLRHTRVTNSPLNGRQTKREQSEISPSEIQLNFQYWNINSGKSNKCRIRFDSIRFSKI